MQQVLSNILVILLLLSAYACYVFRKDRWVAILMGAIFAQLTIYQLNTSVIVGLIIGVIVTILMRVAMDSDNSIEK
jgi:hypothetical protein